MLNRYLRNLACYESTYEFSCSPVIYRLNQRFTVFEIGARVGDFPLDDFLAAGRFGRELVGL